MNYKKSRYNYFVPYKDGQMIIYNFFSNYTSLFDTDTFTRYQNNELTENEQNELHKRGFLIDNDFDEFEKLKELRYKNNTNEHTKLFRIWTTSACNARCFYCFEKDVKAETITPERCNDVIKYITEHINENDTLTIEWFGGEPLLNIPAIEKITKALKADCDSKNAKYSSLFISNGSLLTPEIIDKMENEWYTRHIQITLDGSADAYNDIKNYYDPTKYNFDTVIKNIMLLKDSKLKTAIRINYTKDNYDDIIDLIDYIGPKLKDAKNVIAYVYPIWSNLNKDANNRFVSDVNADKNFVNILKAIVKYNLNSVKHIIRINRKYTSCQACNIGSSTILPNGDISKCSESFNTLYGNVHDGITDEKGFKEWSTREIEPECKDCIFMPICQNGCEGSRHTDMPKCFAFKPVINDMLIWYVEDLQNNHKEITKQTIDINVTGCRCDSQGCQESCVLCDNCEID
jgi:radical SAM protein with 4Fe4S-binding SPASM domain